MAVFKCKMCGGNLEAADGQNIGTCDSCGSTMTLPKANDERILNLFNRATHYRQQNEFDKAIATYENILEEDSENAEAYWGLVLSKYGIEYVEDPKTHKRIPTCHRLQHTSITADLDYKSALKYALDYDAERLYTEEATKIAEIQKNVLAVANSEEAYDIFICYKETDNSGKRTMDSVLAQDIYSQLTNEGYKVFFSRITLEDKLGQEYEPYIFSALNSAKVMLVVGTDKDNFNAVWVKNEWARFLALSKEDKNKIIIPCYKDMDAYDLPDELSMFQSQDMNKIGFLQDLIRGIVKIISDNKNTEKKPIKNSDNFNLENVIVMAKTSLETNNWSEALERANTILNQDATNSDAWYIKMRAIEMQIQSENYEEMRLKEIKKCGENAIKYVPEAKRKTVENEVKASYEKCFEGYLKKFQEILHSTNTYFQYGWGNVQYAVLQANVSKVRGIYISLAEMSKDMIDIQNNISLIEPIYDTLKKRLEISKSRIRQWRPQYQSEQENENRIMTSNFDIITSNLAKSCPEIFLAQYNDLHNITLNERKRAERHKKTIKNIILAGIIAGSIGLLLCLLLGIDSAAIGIISMLLTTYGFMAVLICLIVLPLQIRTDKKNISRQLEKEQNLKMQMSKLGIKMESSPIILTHTCSKCKHTFKVKYNQPENQNKIPTLSVVCPKCKSKEIIKEKNL